MITKRTTVSKNKNRAAASKKSKKVKALADIHKFFCISDFFKQKLLIERTQLKQII